MSFCPFIPYYVDILFLPCFIEERDGGIKKVTYGREWVNEWGGREGGDTVASTGHLAVALAAFRYDKSIVDNQ
jgi:hypothetical protein